MIISIKLVILVKLFEMMRIKKIIKILLTFLITIVGLFLLLIISINLSFGHKLITGKVNNILTNAHIPIHINSINLNLPKSVIAHGITLLDPEGDTIIYAGRFQASGDLIELLKKKVVLRNIYLSNARVNLSRNNNDLQINIAKTFAKEKNDTIINPDVEEKSWDVIVVNAELSYIKFNMHDSVAGIFINQEIRNLKVKKMIPL